MHKATPPNRLRELMTARKMRSVHVAAHCDVDQSTVSRWVTGHPIPDDKKLRLAELFGVSRAHLMGWDEQDPTDPIAV